MSRQLIKVAGNNNGFVKGFSANNDGAVYTTRKTVITKFFTNEQIRDDVNHRPDIVADVSESVFVSFRVQNSLNKSITMRLYNDMYETPTASSTYLKDAYGNSVTFTIPADFAGTLVVTPDDLPLLPYLQFIHIGLKCDQAPTSGKVSVWLLAKG